MAAAELAAAPEPWRRRRLLQARGSRAPAAGAAAPVVAGEAAGAAAGRADASRRRGRPATLLLFLLPTAALAAASAVPQHAQPQPGFASPPVLPTSAPRRRLPEEQQLPRRRPPQPRKARPKPAASQESPLHGAAAASGEPSRRLAAITSEPRHFCFASTTVACRVRLAGTGFADTDRLALVAVDGTCGTDAVVAGDFAMDDASPDGALSSATEAVFSFGAKAAADEATAYRLCLCATGGACTLGTAGDWSLDAGVLSITMATTSVVSVYAGLKFDLTVDCRGSAASGACTGQRDSRYKLVEAADANNADAWDSVSGCGEARQTAWQVLPYNCRTKVMCQHYPNTISDGNVTFQEVLMGPRRRNGEYVSATYDVCFCDGECDRLESWFKAGEIKVKPVAVFGPSTANTPDNMLLLGSQTAWTDEGEMKLIATAAGADGVSSADRACFETPQSSMLVVGHTCTTTTNCSSPAASSSGLTYKSVRLLSPGSIAVCYCDAACHIRQHWFALGRLPVAGPATGQSWSLYESIRGPLVLEGWHLSTTNRIRIIAEGKDCLSELSQDANMDGPSPTTPTQMGGGIGSVASLTELPGSGGSDSTTLVTFAAAHGLAAGCRVTLDGVTCASCSEELGMFNRDHVVQRIVSATVIEIAVGFPSGSYPVMDTAAATWLRSDSQMYNAIRVSRAGRYRVCWRALPAANSSESMEAGTLVVASPSSMASNLYLTAIEPGRVAHVVISFTTGDNRRYIQALEAMQLKLSFVRPHLLAPTLIDGSPLAADTAHDALDEAAQAACGQVLLELHTDDALGFPMPDGCYFNQAEGVWDFYMVFSKGNGLKPSTEYNLVVNANLSAGLDTTQEVVEVWSMDDVVYKRYDALEVGRAKPNRAVATRLRTAEDPAFDEDQGVKILGGTDPSVVTLAGLGDLSLELRATATTPIRAGAWLYVFMYPLLQWNVGGACVARCLPFAGTVCGTVYCDSGAVTGDIWKRNVMMFSFPTGMTAITDTVRHTIVFESLPLPPGGFFPTGLAAELQGSLGAKPHYVVTTGKLVYVAPRLTASLVDVAGDGNSKPFHGDTGNELYAKVVLGATIFSAAVADAKLTITPPAGYTCTGVTDVPDSLAAFAGAVPSGRGRLARGGEHGSWTASAANCQYIFGASQVAFAGSSFYLNLAVDNPTEPLPQGATGNTWNAQIAAKGLHTALLTAPAKSFSAATGAQAGKFAASVSVLGKIVDDAIVPSSFAQGADDNWLFVYFRVEQAVATGGAVLVDAPFEFNFGDHCQLLDLPAYQHADYVASEADVASDELLRLRLPFGEGSCRGAMSAPTAPTFDRATITLTGPLDDGGRYGFRLLVVNPRYYYTEQRSDWRISTRSPQGVRLDECLQSPRFNVEDMLAPSLSWAVHDFSVAPPSFGVKIQDMRPTGTLVSITVFPISLVAAGSGPLTVIAPPGYVWDYEVADFVYVARRAGSAAAYVPGVDADLPIAAAPAKPTTSPFNVLEVANASVQLRPRIKYGFIAKIEVPLNTPVNSANVFILLVGQESASAGPLQAGVAEAPRVLRVLGVTAWLDNAAVSFDGAITFRFDTVSTIPAGGGLVATGPPGFAASASTASCSLSSRGREPRPLAPNCTCNFAADGNSSIISMQVSAAMSWGSWELRVPLRNPAAATAVGATPATWQLETRVSLAAGAAVQVLDYAGSAMGVRIGTPMAAASLVTGALCLEQSVSNCAVVDRQYQRSGRNDRPGETNNLIFEVGLHSDSSGGTMVLRAPVGFEWSPECNVTIDNATVFGAGASLPAGFSPWPAGTTVTRCRGQGRVAFFTVENSGAAALEGGERYAFRVDWVRNPAVQPEENDWTLEFGGEVSAFSGFSFWTPGGAEVLPEQIAQRAAHVVTVRFAPTHDVPLRGAIVVEVPAGFSLGLCADVRLYEESECDADLPSCTSTEQYGTGPTSIWVTCAMSGRKATLALPTTPLQNQTSYVLRLPVTNPTVPTSGARPWSLTTRRSLWWLGASGTWEDLDAANLTGFRVYPEVRVFQMNSPVVPNGMADVSWKFTISFDEALYVEDLVVFTAPSGFNLTGTDGACLRYASLSSGLPAEVANCTVGGCYYDATCDGNVMQWRLRRCPAAAAAPAGPDSGLCVQPASLINFAVGSQNPKLSPAWNRFILRHTSLEGVLSSGTLAGYRIYPLFEDFSAELNSSQVGGRLFEAVGSQSSVRLTFIAPASLGSDYLVIQGGVGTASFQLSTATAYDDNLGTKLPMPVRQNDLIILKRTLNTPGEAVSITLKPVQNPAAPGITKWNISAYKYWNEVQGLRMVISQILDAPGFRVLGYVAIQGVGSLSTLKDLTATCSSTPCAAYFGRPALATINFRSSVPTPAGGEIHIRTPPNYAFLREDPDPLDSAIIRVRLGATLLTPTLVVPAGSAFAGRWTEYDASDAFNSTEPVFKQAGQSRYLWWLASARQWVVSSAPGSKPTGLVGQARGPSDADGAPGDPAPTVPFDGWFIGSAGGWSASKALRWYGEGRLTDAGTQLSLTFVSPLADSKLGAVIVPIQLPTLHQVVNTADAGLDGVERKWLLQTNAGPDVPEEIRRLATNDELFAGFPLVSQAIFAVVPALRAPFARTEVTLALDQPEVLFGIGISVPTSARYELTAPQGFKFPSDCLSAAEKSKASRMFDMCAGSLRVASLKSSRPARIKGTINELKAELVVELAASTPALNIWLLQYYLQGTSQRAGYGEFEGFKIVPMAASLVADSRLGYLGYSYFSFVPSVDVPGGWRVRLEPPAGQGYKVSCIDYRACTMPAGMVCTESPDDDAAAIFQLPANGKLAAGVSKTVAVRVMSPTRLVLPYVNFWKVLIRDANDRPQDASFEVPGVSLSTSYITTPDTISATAGAAAPGAAASASVSVPIDVARDLYPGLVSEISIRPPGGFRLEGHTLPSTLRLDGDSLNQTFASYTISNTSVVPRGRHTIQLRGTITAAALAVGPGGGLWVLQVMRGDNIYFQAGISGFGG